MPCYLTRRCQLPHRSIQPSQSRGDQQQGEIGFMRTHASVRVVLCFVLSLCNSGILANAQATPGSSTNQETTTPPAQQPQQRVDRFQMPRESQPQLSDQQTNRAQQGQTRERPPEEKSSVTHHSAQIGSQQLSYTATAATYIITADDGTPKATFFFVAYTKDGVSDIAQRPVSFVYNGGPGSSSLFTHMGL